MKIAAFPLIKCPHKSILYSVVSICLITAFIIIMQLSNLKFLTMELPIRKFIFYSETEDILVSFKEVPSVSPDISYDQEPENVHEHIALHELNKHEKNSDITINDSLVHNRNIDPKSVVIGCAITSRNKKKVTDLPLFKQLLPSFCKTASKGWKYHFYFSHDHNDPFFTDKTKHKEFEKEFFKIVKPNCKDIFVKLHFVKCSHSGNPAWAQNDAVMEAYIDNHAYFYRINDDTIIKDAGWTQAFVETLAKYDPPNVGVVGPQHAGGNTGILTYDFTHHTHITVFGFHYPRIFTDWYADDWVTKVYQPGRSTKLFEYKLLHTLSAGTRYHVRSGKGKLLGSSLRDGKKIMNRYIKAVQEKSKTVNDGKKIISMSLYGRDGRYIWGAIRNAQITQVFFPEWTLRIYIEKPGTDGSTKYGNIPARIINKLETLGAQIAYVDLSIKNIAPIMWRYLVADDLSIDYFIVRDADSRLSDRDAVVVTEWIKSGKAAHCIRDHPNHSNHSILGGLWGGKPKELFEVLQTSFQDMLQSYSKNISQDDYFLTKILWPKLQSSVYCHDSFSCLKFQNSHAFPVERDGQEYIGQKFDMFGEANLNGIKVLLSTPKVPKCINAVSNRH